MSFTIANVDRAGLPTALLPAAKQHLRVDFPDDDTLIQSLLGRAIDLFERKTGVSVFKSDLSWSPNSFDNWTDDGIQVPAQPFAGPFTVKDANGVDVTSAYQIAGNRIDGQMCGIYLAPVDPNAMLPDGLVITATLGSADADAIAPATLDSLLRLTGHLYANRESVSELLLRSADWWMDDLLVGAWVPRV